MRTTTVKFVEDCDKFLVSINGILVEVGPFKVNDIVTLPEEEASILIRKGKCKLLF